MYRVLVVDDEKLERDGIRFLLSMEEGEWEIYEAANGKLALNELRKHPVDLMLTDGNHHFQRLWRFCFCPGGDPLWCDGLCTETGGSGSLS
ncbi:MAG: hypothetical protein BHV92_00170 [Clostridiales bacterium 45_37]|nr:MAG: hypothetical protein BHV92_00170 [Clostridiales bacterium 45_37]